MSKSRSYSDKNLEEAIEAVKSKKLSKKAAAKLFNIPRSTIQFRLSEKFKKKSKGPNPVLSVEEELLEEWLIKCAKKGFPRRKDDLKYSVQKFLNENKRETVFKDNFPGDGWYHAFLKRHPRLSLRESEGVTEASAAVSENDLKGWFQQVETYLKEEDHFSILSDATRVFNGDETGFQMNPKTGKVLTVKGSRNVIEVDKGLAKSSLTVMFTFSASGLQCPPMIIYPYKRMPNNIIRSVPSSWGIGLSENGWMTAESFYEYMANILIPFIKKNVMPVILFLDGHKSPIPMNQGYSGNV